VAQVRPNVVAMLGITAYRIGFDRRRATVGRQPEDLGGSQLWVVPNPSGLNAHASVAGLAASYREVAVAAGIAVYPRPDDPH
jgi:double-stranded uracil-DNA glycosylase